MLEQLQEQFDGLLLNDPPRWSVAVDRYKACKAALSVKSLHNPSNAAAERSEAHR